MTGQAGRTLRPEDEIAHFRVVAPLGAGGMGEVYLAQDRTLERNVALKILPPDLVRSEDRVRRFELEAKSASQLSHPNIVTIFEIGRAPVRSPGAPDSDPVHYISMELVSGRTLAALLEDERTDVRTLLGYLAQAAEGLSKAHAAGIVHRDLKPGNIMVSADGFTKILDFGLAKLTEKGDRTAGPSDAPTLAATDGTVAGSVVGTADYMSPEQVAGRPVDHRSDIFSFGSILYEATTGRRPFAAATGIETMHRVLNEPPVPVQDINDKVPTELRRLIRRCLAKSPDQRVQSAKDLAIELREIVDEYDTLSRSGASSASQASGAVPVTAARKSPLPRLAIGVIVVAGLAVAGWWGLRGGTKEAPAPAAFQTMRLTSQTSRGDVLDTAISRDGRYLAYLAGAAGRTSLRVRQIATGSDVEVLPTRDAALEGPAFSPDGNYLFYLARKPENPNYRALYQIPSLGGTPRERIFDVDSRVSFSPDGKRVVFWRGVIQKGQTLLVIFDLEASRERVLATIAQPEARGGPPTWSPDGRTIATLTVSPAPNLETRFAMFDADSGARRDVLNLPHTLLRSVDWLPDGRGLVASGQDLRSVGNDQVFLMTYPGAQFQRITNDFNIYGNVTVSSGEEAVATQRMTRVANVWLAQIDGTPARALTQFSNPEDSPFNLAVTDSGSLLFDTPRGDHLQIWSVDPAGGEPRTLTAGDQHSINPAAARNVVVFDRLNPGGIHIWAMSPDGGNLRQVTSGTGEQAGSLSPDGRYVAFVPYDAPRSVSLVEVESGRATPFATDTGSIAGFSSDGSRLLLSRLETDAKGLSRTIWAAFDVPGASQRMTFRTPPGAVESRWAPGNRSISFRDRADPAWNVFRLEEGATAAVQVTRFADGRAMAHAWSPDGTKLAVVHRTEAGSNVVVFGADGSRPVQATAFQATDIFAIRWLPDSRRLAVQAGRLSRDAVLIRDFRAR